MKVKFTTNINEELLKETKKKAIDLKENLNTIIEESFRNYLKGDVEMIKLPSCSGEWNVILEGTEYSFYYKEAGPLQGLFLNGYDSQEEEYRVEGKTVTATKEEYVHNKNGYRYILEIK